MNRPVFLGGSGEFSPLAWRLATYAIGGVAAYWTVERVASFLMPGA